MSKPQVLRLITRTTFFLLYLLAPVFDLFRFDLEHHQFILFRQPVDIGIDAFRLQQISALNMLWNFAELIFLPIVSVIIISALITWKWGLLYCGWLCPHESVVEILNNLMRRASGKFTLWDRRKPPEQQQDNTRIKPNKNWWIVTALVIFILAFTWAIALLTYLVSPTEIYSNLVSANFTTIQLIFLIVATNLFILEFTLARNLFCRFGCSLGLFQSLIWMLNKKALIVGFDKSRANECKTCDQSCEIACPIKLKPRGIKRKMYSCSQCMRCIDACSKVQTNRVQTNKKLSKIGGVVIPLLQMQQGNCALDKSAQEFGKRTKVAKNCYIKPFNENIDNIDNNTQSMTEI